MLQIKTFQIEETPPDSTLAGDVCDSKGNVLLKEGVCVGHDMLQRLRSHGVSELSIYIECHEPSEEQKKRLEKEKVRIHGLFDDEGANSAERTLEKMAVEFYEARIYGTL